MKRSYRLFLLISPAVILLDQITKWIVLKSIPLYGSYPLIEGFFNLVHVRNRGIAFGIMNRPGGSQITIYVLTLVTLAAIFLLFLWFSRLGAEEKKTTWGLALVIGGALGNLVDRIRMGEVVDFLDVHVGTFHWPAFNIADSAITVGVFWLALTIFFSSDPQSGKSAK
ncbi:MAG: signal peptidase II [Desulfobacteraceae bacterium]|nr:MAG: signal peptidase II [Desulfobacteraceae bacterium]